MRLFYLQRDVDATGVSGCGRVAQGVVFDNGKVAITWLTKHTSIAVYDDIDTVIAIHGHDGSTRVEWCDSGQAAYVYHPGVHGPASFDVVVTKPVAER